MRTDMTSAGGLNTDTTIALSQSMDSVNALNTAEEEVGFVAYSVFVCDFKTTF